MKIKRLFISLIIMVMILCTAFGAEAHSFTDYPAEHWGSLYINWAYSQGLMNGIDTDTFSPESPTSRAMLITVLWRYEGSPLSEADVPFTDLNGSWYEPAVAWAYENSIVNGISATEFAPNKLLSRQELATIFYRYSISKGGTPEIGSVDLTSFPDYQKIAPWAELAMGWAYENGIISSSAEGDQLWLNPEKSATRVQMAAIFYRYNERIQNAAFGKDNIVKIMSYNLRNADDPDGRAIHERAARFKVVMNTYRPDVLALQEITPAWVDRLTDDYSETAYGDYQLHYAYRAASSKEATPVMWNTNVLEATDHGVFWLSDTPDTESLASNWGAELYRITTWVKLKVKATGKVFLFMSTRFDFTPTAHTNSVKLIHERAKALGGFSDYPVIVAGDHNFSPWKQGYNAYYNTNDFADVNYELNGDNLPGTVNGYHIGSHDSGMTLDYVFYSYKKADPVHYEVVDMTINGNYVSDHRGIFAKIALK